MSGNRSARVQLIMAAACLLRSNECVPVRIRVRVRGGPRGETQLRFRADGPPALGEAGDDGMDELLAAHFFNEMERDAVLAVADGPLSATAVKARLHLPGDDVPTKLKMTLSGLVERGVLLNARDGYTIADARFVTLARRGMPDKLGDVTEE